jgi:phenylacetate-CoA ligase
MNIWNPEYETMPREEIAQLQLERLQATLNRVYRSVSYYHGLFDSIQFVPEDLNSLEELGKLPFTTKEHIREHYPYGMFAIPLREVVRLHTSTGTGGKQVVVGYTANDINTWSELVARVLTAGGVTADDVVQIAFDYGLFTSGFGLHFGAEKIGASVIPTSSAKISRQVDILRDYRSTVLVSPPSTALAIADHIKENQIDPTALHLRVGLFTAEPWSEEMRKTLEERLMLRASDNYGISEVIGPGVAGECECKCGLHLQEDHFVAEIIDPDTGEVKGPGELGELVLTTLTKEAFPLIRFRTGDLTTLEAGPCSCGRTTARIAKVLMRTDDMVSVRGVHFYPAQVEGLLDQVEGAHPRYQLVIRREGGQDVLEVLVEVSEQIFFDEMRKQREMVDDIRQRILEELDLPARVRLVERRSLKAGEGETPAVIDERPR